MAEGGSHVRWGWLDRVWGDGCWQRWGKEGREGGLGSAQGSVTWVWTGFGQLLLHSWVGGW